jgi:hypothetical protein
VDPNKRFGARRTERRKSKRDELGIQVSLHSITQSRVVLLLDVSTTGARIRGNELPGVGKDVLLKIAGVELFGTVVRTSGRDSAMAFDRPIGPADLEKLQSVMTEQEPEAPEATIEER